ncbi:MAG: undecaprenyldiphospho-muramoylpentapeptide beta-N-acetylglucosaminyltransferase [Elusimicrobiota bacterium]
MLKPNKKLSFIIIAGGTGGHFYPGLSIAKELKKRGHDVRFIVRKNDFVLPILKREQFLFDEIEASGFVRKLTIKNFLVFSKIISGFRSAKTILKEHKPSCVIAMGGYLSFSPVLCAKWLKIPVLLHEQNVFPGLANRWLAKLSDKVALGFIESQSFFPSKSVFTGNPVREEFFQLLPPEVARKKWNLDPLKKTLLVFGGSLGAHKLNELILKALSEMDLTNNPLQVVHFSGVQDEDWVKKEYSKLPIKSFVQSFCHEMAVAFSASDFIVCRAGASTVTELIALKKPSLLVPYPFATNDHQSFNAKVIFDKGAGVVIRESSLSKDKLKEILNDFLFKENFLLDLKSGFDRFSTDPLKAHLLVADLVEEMVK